MKTYSLYILASRPGGAIYVGVTGDLPRRVWEHKQGSDGAHTRRYGIDRLVYYESYDDVRTAIQREKTMKHWPRAWKCNLILGANPTWADLYETLAAAADAHPVEVAGTSPAMTPLRNQASTQA